MNCVLSVWWPKAAVFDANADGSRDAAHARCGPRVPTVPIAGRIVADALAVDVRCAGEIGHADPWCGYPTELTTSHVGNGAVTGDNVNTISRLAKILDSTA
jgi:hypothetical protein